MIDSKMNFRWHALSVFLSLALILLNIKLDWPLMRFSQMRLLPSFVDHFAVFDFIPCLDNDLLICKQYYYGITYLEIIAFFDGSLFAEYFLLMLFILLFLIVVSFLIQVNSLFRLILMQVFVLSPPVMFLTERGNLELLIFSLISISVMKPLSKANFLQSLIIFFASLIKFYPAALLIIIFLRSKNARSRLTSLLLIASFLFIFLRLDFPLKLGATETYCCSFGNNVWGLYLNRMGLGLIELYIPLVGLFFFSLVYVIYSLAYNRSRFLRSLIRDLTLLPAASMQSLQSLLLVFSLLYFSGTNFDYKLIYLLMIPILLLSNKALSHQSRLFHLFSFCSISAFSFPSGNLQPIGDFLILTYFILLLSTIFPLKRKRIDTIDQ